MDWPDEIVMGPCSRKKDGKEIIEGGIDLDVYESGDEIATYKLVSIQVVKKTQELIPKP